LVSIFLLGVLSVPYSRPSQAQAFSDSEGNLTHWDMSVKFVSSQLAVAIAALVNTAGMNVNTKVTVRSVSISGHLRFYPFLEERLVLYGFKEKPATKLQVRVKVCRLRSLASTVNNTFGCDRPQFECEADSLCSPFSGSDPPSVMLDMTSILLDGIRSSTLYHSSVHRGLAAADVI
jgi:hypothetical protein